jgi:hypothetical protein
VNNGDARSVGGVISGGVGSDGNVGEGGKSSDKEIDRAIDREEGKRKETKRIYPFVCVLCFTSFI